MSSSPAFKKARRATKNRDHQSVDESWTAFRTAEKKYKARFRCPDLSGVLDLEAGQTNTGIRVVRESSVYTLSTVPGGEDGEHVATERGSRSYRARAPALVRVAAGPTQPRPMGTPRPCPPPERDQPRCTLQPPTARLVEHVSRITLWRPGPADQGQSIVLLARANPVLGTPPAHLERRGQRRQLSQHPSHPQTASRTVHECLRCTPCTAHPQAEVGKPRVVVPLGNETVRLFQGKGPHRSPSTQSVQKSRVLGALGRRLWRRS